MTADLSASIDSLDRSLARFPGSGPHKVSDLVLYSFAIEAREQVGAVVAILKTSAPRAALANARAALEASIDASYLVAEPTEYDSRAACARVFELFELERLQRRAHVIGTAIPGASIDLEKAVIEDAKAWETDAPGNGQLLIGAWERYSKTPPQPTEHWSGLSRYQLYSQLAGTGADADYIVEALDITYSVLSISGSHARALKPEISRIFGR